MQGTHPIKPGAVFPGFWRALAALAILSWAVSAHADMIEIKDRGILNGTVVSESDDRLEFRDAEGRVHDVARPDVLFLMKENPGELQKAREAAATQAKTESAQDEKPDLPVSAAPIRKAAAAIAAYQERVQQAEQER